MHSQLPCFKDAILKGVHFKTKTYIIDKKYPYIFFFAKFYNKFLFESIHEEAYFIVLFFLEVRRHQLKYNTCLLQIEFQCMLLLQI